MENSGSEIFFEGKCRGFNDDLLDLDDRLTCIISDV